MVYPSECLSFTPLVPSVLEQAVFPLLQFLSDYSSLFLILNRGVSAELTSQSFLMVTSTPDNFEKSVLTKF